MISIIPVEINNKTFGIEISYIKEVIVKKDFFLVPKVPEFTLGFINLRGEVTPCFDLQNILFGTKVQTNGNIIEFAILVKASGKSFAFVVNKVMKVIYIDESQLKSYIENIWKDVKFVKYFVEMSNSLMAIVDVENILKYIDKTNKEFYKYARR